MTPKTEPNDRYDFSKNYAKVGLFHICITDPDLEKCSQRIQAFGGKQLSKIWPIHADMPYKMVYCADPWGNIIEIYTHRYELTWSPAAKKNWWILLNIDWLFIIKIICIWKGLKSLALCFLLLLLNLWLFIASSLFRCSSGSSASWTLGISCPFACVRPVTRKISSRFILTRYPLCLGGRFQLLVF